MKLVVFGASGRVGGHVVRLARERGHDVTAVVRAATAYDAPAGVALVRGDVLDADFVARAVPGHDAAVSALGMRYRHPFARRESPDDFTWRAIANLVAARPPRLSVVSAAGVGDSRAAMNAPMRALLATSNVGVAYRALDRAEELLAQSTLDWQAVRPTTLTHGPRTDRVRVTARYGTFDRIARADVAAYMLRELESERYATRSPMITTDRTPRS